MSKIQGYDYFEGVPLADASEQRWASIIESCDPLLRGAALVGISATKAGAEQAQSDKVNEILEAGALLDDSGNMNRELGHELGLGWSPRADHLELASAGLHIVAAAVRTTELFRNYSVENEDYTGQTGVRFTRRTTLAPVQDFEQGQALGRTLDTYPVRNLQARVFLPAESADSNYSYTELTLAASLHGTGRRPSSMSSVLHTSSNSERGIVGAQITAGFRQGDFISPETYVSFSNLGQYAQAMEELGKSEST